MSSAFFIDFFGEKKVNFRILNKRTDKNKKLYNTFENVEGELKKLNNDGCDIYFVVNSGGSKNKDINHINAFYIDWDMGETAGGEYYPLEAVESYVNYKMEILKHFPLKPSYIVRTRNGLHIYWILEKNSLTNEDFTKYQEALIKNFNSDERIKDPARIMRVPGFQWMKDPQNPYMTKVLQKNNVKYKPEAFDKILNIEKEEKEKTKKTAPATKEPSSLLNENIRKLKLGIYPTIREELGLENEKNIFTSRREALDFIKKQSIAEFLGLDGNEKINCPLHMDKTASASILNNTGAEIYVCHAKSCHFESGTIFHLVQHITNCNSVQAQKILFDIYNVEVKESAWQLEQKEIMENNKANFTSSRQETREIFPHLHNMIRYYIPEIIIISDTAREYVTEKDKDKEGNPIIYHGLRTLAKILRDSLMGSKNRDAKKMSQIIAIFAYLGLINKLDMKDIPEHLITEAKRIKKIKNNQKINSFYSIPAYDHKLLKQANKKAKEFKERAGSQAVFSYQSLYRTFGHEEAARVFPSMKNQDMSDFSQECTMAAEKIILEQISKKGYAIPEDIHIKLSRTKFIDHDKNICNKKAIAENHYKKCIGEILKNNNLEIKRANKELRADLGINNMMGNIIIPELFNKQEVERIIKTAMFKKGWASHYDVLENLKIKKAGKIKKETIEDFVKRYVDNMAGKEYKKISLNDATMQNLQLQDKRIKKILVK